ncbi:MAG: DUF3048 domain-containing protein, partial [Clostridia bacterium]|nr:DUF3048 domain-containing protein [Clostridia bacterium]
PVRSARHYFLDYALENDAIYAHAGQSPQAGRDINALKMADINGLDGLDGQYFHRDYSHPPVGILFLPVQTGLPNLPKRKGTETPLMWLFILII